MHASSQWSLKVALNHCLLLVLRLPLLKSIRSNGSDTHFTTFYSKQTQLSREIRLSVSQRQVEKTRWEKNTKKKYLSVNVRTRAERRNTVICAYFSLFDINTPILTAQGVDWIPTWNSHVSPDVKDSPLEELEISLMTIYRDFFEKHTLVFTSLMPMILSNSCVLAEYFYDSH
jgi:hypothetical protein